MYRNVRAEMARHGITLEKMGAAIGVSDSAMSQKLSGKCVITVEEAKKIRDFIDKNLSIEYLFEVAEVG